jgi:glutathione S-transferase
MTTTLYHAPNSRSMRIVWLAKEADMPIEIQKIPFNREYMRSPEYRAVHPLGKVPALRDGDMTMFESLAIMEYLMAKFDSDLRRSPGDAEYAHYLQWFHFGESTLALPVTLALGHRMLLPEEHRNEAVANWAIKEAGRAFEGLAMPLSEHDYLLPSGFSAADISCGYMLLLAKFAKFFDAAPDPVQAWFGRLTERPGWKAASA